MEFLTLPEARERAADIRASFDALMDIRNLAARKHAAQLRYFRICLDRTLGAPAEALAWLPLQIAQYKFEIEDKLRRLYLRGGRPFAFVFLLVSRRDAQPEQLVVDDDYPETGDYHLLVRDRRELADLAAAVAPATRAQIEMVVGPAASTPSSTPTGGLPAIDAAKLLRWYASDGPAYQDLLHTLTRVAGRGWVLTNPHNPSTKRLMAINVKEIRADHAVARTTEYWYLRWWSSVEDKYRYPYRETGRQTYILTRRGEDWLVQENIRPAPRSSTPHRQ